MRDDQLQEQLLQDMARVKIQRPHDLVPNTILRLRNLSSPSGKGGYKLNKLSRNIGIAAAVCVLLAAGFLTTWVTLARQPAPDTIAGQDIDLTQDSRITEAQQKTGFPAALPTWIPAGYTLKEVQAAPSPAPAPAAANKLTLIFEGPEGTEPLTITQSTGIKTLFPAGTSLLEFKFEEGLNAQRGYYFESRRPDNTLTGRTVFFVYNQTFVTVSSAIAPHLSRNPADILSSEELQRTAGSVVKASSTQLTDPADQYQAANDWIIKSPGRTDVKLPGFIPEGFVYSGLEFSASMNENLPIVTPTLVYSAKTDEVCRIRFMDPEQAPQIEAAAEEVTISGRAAYFVRRAGGILVLTLKTVSACVEISGPETALTREELIALAESVVKPPLPAPKTTFAREPVLKVLVLPTTSRLTFSPDGNMFVGYLPGLGDIVKLWDLNSSLHDLPLGPGTHSDCGPAWWRGSKLVYHVYDEYAEAGKIYVYDTRDGAHLEIDAEMQRGTDHFKPVLIDDDSVAIIADNGLWTYSIARETWTMLLEIENARSLREITWSPDTSKVAWVAMTPGGGGDQLTVLDIASGKRTVAAEGENIPALAWSPDGSRIAAMTSDINGLCQLILVNADGSESTSFPAANYSGQLSWVPGTNLVAYMNALEGLVAVNTDSGATHVDSEITGNHAWLPDGRLAHIPGTSVFTSDGEEKYEVVIYDITW